MNVTTTRICEIKCHIFYISAKFCWNPGTCSGRCLQNGTTDRLSAGSVLLLPGYWL